MRTKILITILIIVGLTGCQYRFGGEPNGKILDYEKKGDVIEYTYVSKTKVPKETIKVKGKEYEEDLTKRTSNAQFFKEKKDTKLVGAVGDEEWFAKIYTTDAFYASSSDWYFIETATTTARASIFDVFTKPVYADSTTTYTSAGDQVIYSGNANWTTARNATTGTVYNHTASYIGSEYTGGSYYIYHAYFPFVTSILPDDATISGASLNLYSNTVLHTSDESAVIVRTNQASITSQSAGDYDTCGLDSGGSYSLGSPELLSSYVAFTGISTGGYVSVPLNATGIGYISKTGNTLLGGRDDYEIGNTSPSTAARTYWEFARSTYTGTSRDPYLSVTYTTGGSTAASPVANIINFE